MLSDERYSCQIKLPGFGVGAQQKLSAAKVLVIGIGGLGCPVAQYLASAGIGVLGIADFDVVSMSNLHRQILYNESDAGQKKVHIAAKRLQAQNTQVEIVPHDIRIAADNIVQLIDNYDVVLDCTDNFDSRYLINDTCVLAGKPVVYGAIYQYEGQVAVWNMQNEDGSYTPNYRDVFPDVNTLQIPDCNDGGVLPTLAGMVGCMQATESIKLITGIGEVLAGKLAIIDMLSWQWQIVRIGNRTATNITSIDSDNTVGFISDEALKKLLDSDCVLLVDVRTKGEHAIGNIGGVNVPLGDLEGHLSTFNNISKVVFYCASGKRSLQAARWLKNQLPGMEVLSLENGINNWPY